jgi:hypothetical protein
VRLSSEEESRKVFRVTVEVDQDWLIRGKETVERVLGQGVRVETFLTEDEEVVHVDNSNSYSFVAQDSRGGNNFVSDLDSDTDKDDIGVLTTVSGESGPDGSTGNAVTVSLSRSGLLSLWRQS